MPHTTTADDTRLYTKIWGEGRPVVLMHGWPLTADSWDFHAMRIAEEGYRVIAYDRRGFGRSEQPWTGYDYDTLADDLASVLAATDARDATIIGFSMGGGEVARYMSRHDGRGIAQAGLVSSVVPYLLKTDDNPKGVEESVFKEIVEGLEEDRPHFYAGFFKDFYGDLVSKECLQWTRSMAMQASLKATIECAKAFAYTDFRGDLPAIDVPTLIVHGVKDQTVPIDTSGRPAAEGIKNSIFKEYEEAPHGLTATHRDQLTDDLIRFLSM